MELVELHSSSKVKSKVVKSGSCNDQGAGEYSGEGRQKAIQRIL